MIGLADSLNINLCFYRIKNSLERIKRPLHVSGMNYLRDLEDYLEKKKVVHRGRTLGIPPAKMAMGYRPVGPGGHPAHRNSPAEIRDLNGVYLLPVLGRSKPAEAAQPFLLFLRSFAGGFLPAR